MISVWCRVVQCGAAVWWAGVLIITYHQLHHPTLLLLSGDTTLPHWDWGEGIQYSVLRVECSEEARKFPVWLLQVRAGQASKEWLGLTEPGCVIIMTNINSPALDITPLPLSLPLSLRVWRLAEVTEGLEMLQHCRLPDCSSLWRSSSPLSTGLPPVTALSWLAMLGSPLYNWCYTDWLCSHRSSLHSTHVTPPLSVLITAVNSIAI